MKYNNVIIWQVTWNTLGRCFSATVTGKSFTPWWQVYPRRPPQRDVNPGWWTWFRCVSVKWLDRICGGPGGVNGRGGRADCKCSHLETLIWNKYGGVNSGGVTALIRPARPWSWADRLSLHMWAVSSPQGRTDRQTDICIGVNVTTLRRRTNHRGIHLNITPTVILTHCVCCYSYSPLEALLGTCNKK